MRNGHGMALAALVLSAVATACGSDGNSLRPPAANISGNWTVTLTRDAASNDCTNPNFHQGTFPVPLMVTHTSGSNAFTATSNLLSVSTTGTIDGDEISFAISPQLPSYCASLSIDVILNLGPTGKYANGMATWTCAVSGGGSCGGSDTVIATLP
jgi:hypothetical protein